MRIVSPVWAMDGAPPGWGIVADLTPPELIADRRLKVVRRIIAIGLAVVLGLCGVGYGYAVWQGSSATDALAAEQTRTASLLAEQHRYIGVTAVHAAITQVQQQLGGLMSSDVDVDKITAAIVAALPPTMTIGDATVTVTGVADAASGSGQGNQPNGVGGLDTSDAHHIGTVTLSGTGKQLTDLAAYVDALRKVPGVFEPYPLSNEVVTADAAGAASAGSGAAGAAGGAMAGSAAGAATATSTNYSLQLTLTDALLTHRFAEGGAGS